jgi:hypothetical protein
MSWEIFKQNIVRISNRPGSIPDIDTVARAYAVEYDAAIKRGFDTLNNIAIQQGDVATMERLFKIALQKGLSSTGPYDLVGEMGKGVIAYWSAPGGPASIGGEPSTQELLDKIPDDNNTLDAAKAISGETGSEILTDGGDGGGPQTTGLKSLLPRDNPPYQTTGGESLENESPTSTKEGEPVKCSTGIGYDTLISPNFRLRDLSIGTTFPHKIKAQVGLTQDDIICNLKYVAINILEPLKAQYPNIKINSAFRGTPSLPDGNVSQHQKGEAVDIQIPGISPKQYLPVANWIKANLPFDQMIFEHGNSIWLHLSCKRSGNQRKKLTTMINGNYEFGIKCYYA